MSAKHTPGPWKSHFEEAYFVTGPDLGRVAMMMNLKGALGLGGRRSGSESVANCRLIAAAPDMLAALQRIAEYPRQRNDELSIAGARAIAAAAIAKATGEAQ